MKKYTKYCDICGKKITKRTKIKLTILNRLNLSILLLFLITSFVTYEGEISDLCDDCYCSFKKWIDTRKKIRG